jgi:Na+/phosphate symporter
VTGVIMFDPAREVVLFHLSYNVALALLFIFWTEKIARIAERLLPARRAADNPATPVTRSGARSASCHLCVFAIPIDIPDILSAQ